MTDRKKKLRYYYWFTLEFTKKHSKKILLSFFLSFFVIVSVISFSSYLDALFFSKRQVIGMIGLFDASKMPPEILEKISYGLVLVDDKGSVKPALAERWEVLEKGKSFRFHLKPNLTWDDNQPFTARDLSYSFKDFKMKVENDRTVTFTNLKFNANNPFMLFPVYLTKPIIKYPLKGVVGPYRVENVKFKQGIISELSLIPHTNDLSPITYKFYENDTKLINAFKAGEIYEMDLIKKSSADQFQGWRNLTVTPNVDYSVVMTLFINTKNQMLADKGLRKAIGQAIPRDDFKLFGENANGPISPISWAYFPDLKRETFDLDAAKKDIKKATEGSESATLKLLTYYDYSPTANDIQKKLEEAGLKIDVTYSNQQNPNDFDFLLSYWQTPSDPDQYFYWHSTQAQGANITQYKNVRIDKLLEDGRSTLNINERKKFYEQFQKVLIDDSPAIFIYHPYTYTVKRI